jgi:hypothetical protein
LGGGQQRRAHRLARGAGSKRVHGEGPARHGAVGAKKFRSCPAGSAS